MGFLSKLFGMGPKVDYGELMKNGAVIVDVRTSGEFQSGHVKGSKNIPLNNIQGQASKIKSWNKPVIVCCASGMRSASAKSILASAGVEVYNAGSWSNLNHL